MIFMFIELAIGVAIGFIPYVDNFGERRLPMYPNVTNRQ
jgi:hypothetical protein